MTPAGAGPLQSSLSSGEIHEQLRDLRAIAEAPGPGTEQVAATLAALAAEFCALAAAPAAPPVVELARSSRLSPEMVCWGLKTTFRRLSAGAFLEAAASEHKTPSGRLAVLIMASNLFLSGFETLALLLLRGSAVFVKASSRDAAFPSLVKRVLDEIDPAVGRRLRVEPVPGREFSLDETFGDTVDAVIAFGSDQTIGAIRTRLPERCSFTPKGHGLGAIVLPEAGALGGGALEAMALDIAAYDQRGCLSPQFIIVEGENSRGRALAVGEALAHEALPTLQRRLPRGPLHEGTRAAVLQWRGVAQAIGELFVGVGGDVSVEESTPPRMSPGHRHISIVTSPDRERTVQALRPFGAALKLLALPKEGLPPEHLPVWKASDLNLVRCRVCTLGSMQTPPFPW